MNIIKHIIDVIRLKPKLEGLFRGIVVNNNDPLQLKRLRARVPDVLDDMNTSWAMPCIQSRDAAVLPVGSPVWIMFEQGDSDYPVWIGTWVTTSN